mgnify:CR=1 FL=1
MLRETDTSRLNWLIAIFLAFFFVLSVRLYNLQVIHNQYYSERAHSNRTRFIRDRAQRGRMIDRNGIQLAATKPSFSLFITPEDFRIKIEEGDLLEWQEVYKGNFYGTLKSQVKFLLDQGKNIIFDVDVVGGLNIKKHFGDRALSVFVSPPSPEELENRLRSRNTDSEETINKRMEKARWELGFAPRFDYILVNNDLETAKKEAHKVVTEFLKPKY